MPKTSAKAPKRRPPRAARSTDDMQPEYDWSRAVRNPYASRVTAASNIVVLEPDVAAVFPNSASVNEALRSLAAVMAARGRAPKKRARTA